MVFGLNDKGVEEADCEKGGQADDESDIVHFSFSFLLFVLFFFFQVNHYHFVFAVEQAGGCVLSFGGFLLAAFVGDDFYNGAFGTEAGCIVIQFLP